MDLNTRFLDFKIGLQRILGGDSKRGGRGGVNPLPRDWGLREALPRAGRSLASRLRDRGGIVNDFLIVTRVQIRESLLSCTPDFPAHP